jgi:hypothetical protein
MYRAYDTLAQLAGEPGTRLVAGHDPAVRDRFARDTAVEPAGPADEAGDDNAVQVTDLTRPRAG